jgi:hypothetical protein
MSSDTATAKGRIKGAAIRDFIAWHITTFGPEPMLRAIRALPKRAQAEFDVERPCMGVLPSAWLEGSVAHQVLDQLLAGLSAQQRSELARGGAEATIQGMMSGAQRIVFAVMTPTLYAKVANVAFRLNYGAGTVINEELGTRRHRASVENWLSHHPFLCHMNVNIKAAVYRAMGCEQVEIETRFCKDEGDNACGSIIRWQ